MQTAAAYIMALRRLADPERAKHSARFFKTGAGEYGEGDKFLGVTVPQNRRLVRQCDSMPMAEVEKLMKSRWHEVRLGACLILVRQYEQADRTRQAQIFDFYLAHSQYVNNWDLVDTSTPNIVGMELLVRQDWSLLEKLAQSKNIWERRMAMLATLAFTVKAGDARPTYVIAEKLQADSHDLIQKAVGWMLREAGKRVSEEALEAWLQQDGRYKTLPRTLLRYAIERLPQTRRKQYLRGEL